MSLMSTRIAPLLLLALTLTLTASACSAAKADDAKAPTTTPAAMAPTYERARTQVVVAQSVPETLVVTGTIQPRDRAELVPDTSGKVVELMVDRGDRVKAGDPLVRLDTRSAELSEKEARANLGALRAQQKLADDTCRRSKELLEKGAITQSEYDRDQAACVQAASARLDRAGQSLDDGLVRAPFSGIIAERFVSLGEWASPQNRLFTLVDDGVLRADLSLSESAAVHAQLGASVEVMPVAAPDQVAVGTITRVGVEIDPKTRGFLVEVTLPETTKLTLKAGMFVKAAMATGQRELPAVPASALVQRGSTWRVFAVVGDKLEERVVQLGPDTADGHKSIARGLSPGDTFAIDAQAATDGLAVR
ncbi:MAG TPA: efflux RND transporter periplasmic adaptor subunit [Myxococcota bacterium]|nr:efflux RND transporter periplasmic adaptor subunit [Myxococcota bacterium]